MLVLFKAHFFGSLLKSQWRCNHRRANLNKILHKNLSINSLNHERLYQLNIVIIASSLRFYMNIALLVFYELI